MVERAETPETVRELASACEQYVQQSLNFQLDYTVETLAVLDQYAEEVRDTLEVRPELMPLLARALGAYFGEVLCRTAPGFWRLPSENIADWQVCLTNVFVWMNPIGVAYDALSGNGQHDGPSSTVRVAPEDRELVRARLGRLADVDEEEYYRFTIRMEVLELVIEELTRVMQERGYGDSTFDASDYEAEQRSPLL